MIIYNYEQSKAALEKLFKRGAEVDEKIVETVKKILHEVKTRGDEAVFHFTREFDRFELHAHNLVVDRDVLKSCYEKIDATQRAILEEARDNIEAFHVNQKEESWLKEFPDNVRLGQRITPLDRVGVYIPGGQAFYPSTAMMNIVPAKIAGVREIVAVTPPTRFMDNPIIGATLYMLGVDRVFLCGGAQAIAALAYGTEIIPRVDKIVGPGNIYVSEAKRLVFGQVDIDMIAGPSEVVVLAQDQANPRWTALDVLSQAEHRTGFESAMLITDSQDFAEKVKTEIFELLKDVPYGEKVKAILAEYGAIIVVDNMKQGAEVVNRIAPEHLEVVVKDVDAVLPLIRHAGAIFIGEYSSEPVGDYWAGPNHVLPTSGTARFFSPLGVYDFVKRSSLIYYSKEAILKHGRKINQLAMTEDLIFHGRAVLERCEALENEQ
ncbi:MAG: histidinol dehydrogenase [Spirochaetales bacterium]|nr:histidinol dehydrogenase [Spirochaetales bacterium]